MPSAAILAGGHATRFGGRDKGALIVGGRPILDRQMAELATLCDDIMLVVGEQAPAGPPAGLRLVRDRVRDCGPLGGLDAALAAARHDAAGARRLRSALRHRAAARTSAGAHVRGRRDRASNRTRLSSAVRRIHAGLSGRHRRPSRSTPAQDGGFSRGCPGPGGWRQTNSRRWAIPIGSWLTSTRRRSTMASTRPLVTNCNRITNLPTFRSSR